ncbi:hypothetical protein AB0M02_23555 [Actinoplanes sp. NPDC051861]|uniref:hypothetical protein n=1 Tax=Actinoplanes sp. NPDC051861 TaxID=3155170 RepID=UPI003443AC15
MIWHRIAAHRRYAANNSSRWVDWRLPEDRNRRTSTGQVVFREPEETWWRLQTGESELN